jgi:hypothetical protein
MASAAVLRAQLPDPSAGTIAGRVLDASTGTPIAGAIVTLVVAQDASPAPFLLALSAGSACTSGSGRPSHVLRALGLSDSQARSSIRLGFGRYTGEDELASACRRIDEAARAQEGLAA